MDPVSSHLARNCRANVSKAAMKERYLIQR